MTNAPIAIAETLCLFTFILFVTLFEIMWLIPRAIIHPSIAVPLTEPAQKLVAHFWKVAQPNVQWAANLFCSPLLWVVAHSLISSIGFDALITIGKLPDCNLSTPCHLICCLASQASVSLLCSCTGVNQFQLWWTLYCVGFSFGFSGVFPGMQLMRYLWLHI